MARVNDPHTIHTPISFGVRVWVRIRAWVQLRVPVQRALVAKWTRNGGELANAVPLERERGGDPIAAPEDEEEAAIPRGLRHRMRHEAAMGQGFGDIDDWGPQDAGDVPEHGAHGNVHSWSSAGSSPF